jgi:predicted unusual protein kinase regulating ubiquinone biosynthesis (AarF/ABC1/UbiB family)
LKNSFFISEFFDCDFTIREVLLSKSFNDKDIILKSFSRFVYYLHSSNILHLDLSPGNILIKKDKAKNQFIFKIVDINRMKFKQLSLNEKLENFSKLWASDDDMKIIIKEYCIISNINEKEINSIIQKAIYYSQKHKNRVNFKKILRGIKVVD